MKTFSSIFFLLLTSCHLRFVTPGYYTPSTTVITPSIITPPVTNYWWSYRPNWIYRNSWSPRSPYLGNVYNSYNYYNYGPRNNNTPPRTNLPLNQGPRGGRRK